MHIPRIPRQKNPQKAGSSRGFTLLEMMVVLVVIGILAAIGLPSFRAFGARQNVRLASYELQSAMMYARSEALKRNTNVTISQASGGWQNGWTVAASGTLRQQGVLNGVTITVTNTTSISFGRDGRANSAPSFMINPITSISGVGPRCVSLTLTGLPNTKAEAC